MPDHRRDLWAECYTGEHSDKLSPQAFKYQFCSVCRNSGCTGSAAGKSRWQSRIETQVDRLLDNPERSDPNDPRYREVREMDFKDLFREAMKLEIADKKGDWEPITENDAIEYAVDLSRPAGFEPDPDPDPEPVIVRQDVVRGSGGKNYTVTIGEYQGQPVYDCTCQAFEFERTDANGMCKHIRQVLGVAEPEKGQKVAPKAKPEEGEREAVLPPPKTRKSPGNRLSRPSAEQWLQVSERHLVPRANNTRFPSEGMMIDGSPPPPAAPPEVADPWAPKPEPTGTVIEVGGSFVLGGDEEE